MVFSASEHFPCGWLLKYPSLARAAKNLTGQFSRYDIYVLYIMYIMFIFSTLYFLEKFCIQESRVDKRIWKYVLKHQLSLNTFFTTFARLARICIFWKGGVVPGWVGGTWRGRLANIGPANTASAHWNLHGVWEIQIEIQRNTRRKRQKQEEVSG